MNSMQYIGVELNHKTRQHVAIYTEKGKNKLLEVGASHGAQPHWLHEVYVIDRGDGNVWPLSHLNGSPLKIEGLKYITGVLLTGDEIAELAKKKRISLIMTITIVLD